MLEHWLWLANRQSITDYRKCMLLRHFQTAEAVYAADREEYSEISDLSEEALASLLDKSLEHCKEIISSCARECIQIVTYADAEYPNRLKNIYDPPLVLYYKGTLPDFDTLPVVGVVGTRKPSVYGESAARRLGKEISACGGVVISGLASGIDAAAMNGALLAGCGPVGVLGCGVDVLYPKSNKALFAATQQYGCILSEFEPGAEPIAWHFPRRNRIISGLSCGVLVVEAPEKSGSLITARCALDQGRDVFVVPGNIDMPGFVGSTHLLRDGAAVVSCGWDIMREYQATFPAVVHRLKPTSDTEIPAAKVAQEPKIPDKKPERKPVSRKKDIDKRPDAPYIDLKVTLKGLSEDERAIVSALTDGERLVDDVIAQTGISTGKVLCALTMLELKRVIVRLPGKRISLRNP